MIPAGPVFHKPKSFIAAKNLLFASIFIGVLTMIIPVLAMGAANNDGMKDLFLTAVAYLIIFFLIKQMGFCKKWARTTLVVLFLLAVASFLLAVKGGYRVGILRAVLLSLQTALVIIALIFLYTKESNNWFNSRTSETLP